jgi:hypothetical protein
MARQRRRFSTVVLTTPPFIPESTYEMAEPAAVANTVPNKAQTKGAKRKQGFSLATPGVKRCAIEQVPPSRVLKFNVHPPSSPPRIRWYGEKGARIGSSQAPPNKLAPPAVDD